MIVLDTNVVSAIMRPHLNEPVATWFTAQDPTALRTTIITAAEIEYGIAVMPDGHKRRELAARAAQVWELFPDAVLVFDREAASAYGAVCARRERAGRPIGPLDAQIAAICLVHGATLATRNVKDFDGTGVDVVDPWLV